MNLLGFKKILLLILGLSLMFTCESKDRNNRPLVWDMEALMEMKANVANNTAAKEIIRRADHYCKTEPIIITSGRNAFVSDSHYYFSMAPYRWPDPEGSGQYIWKDGEVNPESREYGSAKLSELCNRCLYLSKAFFLTEEKKYYNAFVAQLQAWFINKETYMYPSFEYAQVIPGVDNNKGNPAGQIESYNFNTIIESIRLVNGVKRINKRIIKGLKAWFIDFIEESEKRCGSLYKKSNSNIALSYDVTLINMYLFVGKESKAKDLADTFAERRINVQILEDGSQPDELKRTNAFSYSLVNLTHMVDGCVLIMYWDKDYYSKHCERIDRAFEYLQQYIDEPEIFPYKQIAGWDGVSKDFEKLKQRKELLRIKR